jgi:2-dehydropantoate 2-reductase
MRVAVIGAGGVGGYFGARLAAAGASVAFVARGTHLAAIRAGGLRLESPKGDLHLREVVATDAPSSIGSVDVVLLTVKMYDLDTASAMLAPLIGPDTVVVTLQNGVEAVDIVARHVGAAHVAGGVAYVAAVIAAPGVIRHTALDALIFGEVDGRPSTRLAALEVMCRRAGFNARLSDQILVDVWAKFARLSVFSAMTAVTRSPMGAIRADPDLYAMLNAGCEETIAVGRAHGVQLPVSLMDDIRAMVDGLPYEAKASMLEDLERGKRLELPWLSGAVVRLGEAVGVPTPIHRFIAAVLKPHMHGATAPVATVAPALD